MEVVGVIWVGRVQSAGNGLRFALEEPMKRRVRGVVVEMTRTDMSSRGKEGSKIKFLDPPGEFPCTNHTLHSDDEKTKEVAG